MTKVQTINRLGLKIYDMRIRNGQEISAEDAINKPLPPKRYLKVTDPQGLCKQNINKFRFLFNYGGGYGLTEYEYRESTGEYFPVIRETIPEENFEKYKVDPKEFSTFLRADRAPGHQNKTEPKGIIYIIRLSDIIYETDEYDHPINYSKNIASLSTANLGKLSTSLDFMISMINNSEDYIESHPSTKFNLTDLYKEIYHYLYNTVDWIDLPKELSNPEITKIKDMKELIEHFLPENYTATDIRLLNDCLSSVIRALIDSPRSAKARIVDSCAVTSQEAEEIYDQVITSSLSIYGSNNVDSDKLASLSGKNYQMYDKQLDDISDKALKNTYTDERSYELAKRFMKAKSPKIGIEKDDNFDAAIQQDIYHPYKVLQDNSRSILKLDNIDTGDHSFRIGNSDGKNRYSVK